MNGDLTPDKIRDTALAILAKSVEGIKQADLFKKTEFKLSENFNLQEHSVRNALWNLPEKYPEYVIKRKTSYRDVRLYPTNKLVEKNDKQLSLSNLAKGVDAEYLQKELEKSLENFKKEKELEEERVKQLEYTRNFIYEKTMEISRFIDFSDIESALRTVCVKDITSLEPFEAVAFSNLKLVIEQFRSVRNDLVHGNDIRNT